MGSIAEMNKVAKAIDDINTGYNQARRWSFINPGKRELIPNQDGDCSSVCGAIAYLGGYIRTLPTGLYTGNMKTHFEAVGFRARPYKSLADLKQGEFVLHEKNHVEYMYTDDIMFSANSDENGKATGGHPGDQTGKEVYFKPKFVYRLGWEWVLTPPLSQTGALAWTIGKNYNPQRFGKDYTTNVQNLLNANGYSLDPDGILGEKTYAAVLDYQMKNGLEEDGIPGPNTLAKLEGSDMSGTYIYKQGVKVAPGTYYYYEKLRAAFKKATGFDLLITSGLRTYAEQKSLYDRWKKGTFIAPSVAYPGTSLHEGGRALDLRDSGSSAGVTVAGNARSNWMRANASKYGFNATGYNFGEPWHFELQSRLSPWKAPSGGSSSGTKKLDVDGKFGPASVGRLQSVLKTTKDDWITGQVTSNRKRHANLINVKYGKGGSAAVLALQKKLGVKYGKNPGQFGPATISAWQRKLGVDPDGYFGPTTAKAAQRKLNQGKVF